MAADPLRCPACSGTLSAQGQPRCEWCGAALPAAPAKAAPVRADLPRGAERDRLAAILEQMQSRQEVRSRSHGVGCLFFVLLLLAIAFVLFVTMTPRTLDASATPDPHPAPVDANGPEPAAPDGR